MYIYVEIFITNLSEEYKVGKYQYNIKARSGPFLAVARLIFVVIMEVDIVHFIVHTFNIWYV